MRKTWIHKRPKPGGKGFYYFVKWIDELGKERAKSLPNAALAKHFKQLKYHQLNSDVFTDDIPIDWEEAKKEYKLSKKTQGFRKSATYQALFTLQHFEKACPVRKTRDITQSVIDRFIRERIKKVGKWTVNKNISNLKAFLNWLNANQYHKGGIKLKKIKAEKPIIKIPSNDQISSIIKACPSLEWQLRILLALCTGLRKTDLYELSASSIDLNRMWLGTTETKTGKHYSIPLPDSLLLLLKEHLKSVSENRKYLFSAHNSRWLDSQWRDFRPFNITMQDLRRTNKTLLQKIGSLSSVNELIGHSDNRVTEQFYTDNELIMRWKINQLPVKEWLK